MDINICPQCSKPTPADQMRDRPTLGSMQTFTPGGAVDVDQSGSGPQVCLSCYDEMDTMKHRLRK